jgi:hypothetical protein
MTPSCRSPRRQPRHSFTVTAAAILAAAVTFGPAACSSGSDNHPAGIDTGGGGPNGGNSAANVGGSSGNGSATAGDSSSFAGDAAGAAGAAPDAGFESDAGPGRAPPGPSTCSQTAVWSGATTVSGVSSSADETFLSLTPDELDLAFLRAGALYVAHRAGATAPFTVSAPIALPDGWSAAQGAALSADGRRLVLLSTDQTLLSEMTRASRDAAFSGTVDQTAFSAVNETSMYSGNIYAAPVLSADDQQLFLNSASIGGASTIVASTREASQPWSLPTRVIAALDGAAGARRLPTGISADARTLFYFNEGTMKEEARWRDEPLLTSPLYDVVDLGTRGGAQPNTACDKLYSNAAGDVIVEHD